MDAKSGLTGCWLTACLYNGVHNAPNQRLIKEMLKMDDYYKISYESLNEIILSNDVTTLVPQCSKCMRILFPL